MKIRAKTGGELNMHGPGVHWIHKSGDERDFPEDVGKQILTNKNYETLETKKVSSTHETKSEKKSKEINKDNYEKKDKDKEGLK